MTGRSRDIRDALILDMVEDVLRHPHQHTWSYQGLGMLRVYLRADMRLHVWVPSLAVPGASPIHTHPWDFESYVVCGKMVNQVYMHWQLWSPNTHTAQMLKCGGGGGLVGAPFGMHLEPKEPAVILPGQSYYERAEDFHEAKPVDGTVTIIRRYFKTDRDHAYVVWPLGQDWGSAEPRDAGSGEIDEFCEVALSELEKVTR